MPKLSPQPGHATMICLFIPFPSSDTASPAAVARPGRSNQGTHPSPPPAAETCQMCRQMCPLPVAQQLWAPLHVIAGPTTFSASGRDHLPQLPTFLLPCPRNPLLGCKPLNALNTPLISCWLFNHKQSMIFFFFFSPNSCEKPFFCVCDGATALWLLSAVLQLSTGQLSHSGSPARSSSLPLQAEQRFSASPETTRFFLYSYSGQGKDTALRPMEVTKHRHQQLIYKLGQTLVQHLP